MIDGSLDLTLKIPQDLGTGEWQSICTLRERSLGLQKMKDERLKDDYWCKMKRKKDSVMPVDSSLLYSNVLTLTVPIPNMIDFHTRPTLGFRPGFEAGVHQKNSPSWLGSQSI